MFGGNQTRWHLFTFRGHKVYLEPWFLLLVAFFVFMGLNSASQLLPNLMWAPVLFLGVLLHEFGHAAAIKAFGYGSSTIILQGFGGVTINSTRQASTPGQAIIISLAGPGASLALALVSWVGLLFLPDTGSYGMSLLAHFLQINALANTFWAAFNLLPINPMDGGHVVLHGLRKFVGQRKAMLYSAYSSLAVLGLIVLALLATGLFARVGFLAIILAIMFGMQNVQIIKALNSQPRW